MQISRKWTYNGHPPWTTLMAAMPGHTRSTFRGARAALSHRFTAVRTPPQSRATHNDKTHSAASNAPVSVQAQRAANIDTACSTGRVPCAPRTTPPTQGRCQAPPAPIRHMHSRGGFVPPGPQLSFSGPTHFKHGALERGIKCRWGVLSCGLRSGHLVCTAQPLRSVCVQRGSLRVG